MSSILLIKILTTLTIATANEPVCDQHVYDVIYNRILDIVLASQLTPKDIDEKNDSIETLRALCKGQKSSYETH
jgi:hypothetical protein